MHSVSWLRIEIPHKPSSAFLTRAFSIQVSTVSNMSTNRLFCPTKHHRTSHGSALFKHLLLVFVGILTGPMFEWLWLPPYSDPRWKLRSRFWYDDEPMHHILARQGVTVGLGCGCLFVPCVAILPSYFSTRKAQGLVASGSSLGGIIYPILFHKLLPCIGFGWATRVMACVVLATLAVPILCMKMRVKPVAARWVFDLSGWPEAPFSLFSIAKIFGFMGLYVPFFYIQIYALESTYIDKNLAFYLPVLLNTGSFFGRIVSNLSWSFC